MLLVQLLHFYDILYISYFMCFILIIIKVLTTATFPNLISNSYDNERLSNDLNNHPVMSYMDLALLIVPHLIIIICSKI